MVDKNIVLNTIKGKFYRQYLEIIRVFPPYNKLRDKEIDILAEFFRLNNEYSHLDESIKWKIIFEYSTKIQIKDKLNISDANFNNILTSLRSKGLIVNNKIPTKYLFTTGKKFKLNINFNIAD